MEKLKAAPTFNCKENIGKNGGIREKSIRIKKVGRLRKQVGRIRVWFVIKVLNWNFGRIKWSNFGVIKGVGISNEWGVLPTDEETNYKLEKGAQWVAKKWAFSVA